jgi:drug/metabolite transporter (DMT)-like permease
MSTASRPVRTAAPSAAAPPSHAPFGHEAATPLQLGVAFAAVYVIWGSTYLSIRYAIETIPPFTMAGLRFVTAGGVLYVWTRWHRGVAAPTRAEWRSCAIVGGLLLLGGNGAVVWSEQWVPSGLAALLVATVPLWMVLLDWGVGGSRPGPGLFLGLLWGLAGVGLLVGTPGVDPGEPLQLAGTAALLGASVSWAAGSIYSRSGGLPTSPRLATAMQMLTGGGMLLALGLVSGEIPKIDLAAVSLRSMAALVYLIVAGSLVAFSAYIWLLRHASAARVSTYAYVNPVVALLLGWALADEPLTPRTLLAAAVILTAVMVVSVKGKGRPHHDA